MNYVEDIVTFLSKFIKYDPNYAADEEDDDKIDFDTESQGFFCYL